MDTTICDVPFQFSLIFNQPDSKHPTNTKLMSR